MKKHSPSFQAAFALVFSLQTQKSQSRLSILMLGLAFLLASSLAGCDGCDSTIGPVSDGGSANPSIACRFNSDCGERSYCGDEGFCLAGLPEGQCLEQSDCEDELTCIFPDDAEVGSCVNLNKCDDDVDCLEGQECVLTDEGFRQCEYVGCQSDDECVLELGDACSQNETAKCIARACQCRDLCGADCGEGRQCCAPLDEGPMCMGDPGPCSQFSCAAGFAGTTDAPGEWSARACDYDQAQCACEELPPLPVGRVGYPHQLLHLTDNSYVVIAYNSTYGDLMLGVVENGEVQSWQAIAGVPEASQEAPIVAGPSGPRGGVEAVGDDVGAYLDAMVHPATGEIHILATDLTNKTLLHFKGTDSGSFTSRILETDDAPGYFPKLILKGDGRAAYAYVAARDVSGRSRLRVAATLDFSDAPSTFVHYDLKNVALDDVNCQGGCQQGFVCQAAALADGVAQCVAEGNDCGCVGGDVCTATGCAASGAPAAFQNAQVSDALAFLPDNAGAVLFFHDVRGQSLDLFKATGNLYDGTATFVESTLSQAVGEDHGRNVSAARNNTGFAVVSASNQRQVWLHLLDDTSALIASSLLDDGRKLMGPNGPYDQQAVDAPVIGLDAQGKGIIAWQNGTEGGIYGRNFTAPAELGPSQPLAGGPFSAEYAGTLALGLSAADDGSAVSAQRVLLEDAPGDFTVIVPNALLSCPTDDPAEDDDNLASATALIEGGHARGMICSNDVDVFDLGPVAAGCIIDAELLFETDDGDLDLFLHTHSDQSNDVEQGYSSSDNEFLSYAVAVADSFTLRVEGYSGEENAYILRAMVTCP